MSFLSRTFFAFLLLASPGAFASDCHLELAAKYRSLLTQPDERLAAPLEFVWDFKNEQAPQLEAIDDAAHGADSYSAKKFREFSAQYGQGVRVYMALYEKIPVGFVVLHQTGTEVRLLRFAASWAHIQRITPLTDEQRRGLADYTVQALFSTLDTHYLEGFTATAIVTDIPEDFVHDQQLCREYGFFAAPSSGPDFAFSLMPYLLPLDGFQLYIKPRDFRTYQSVAEKKQRFPPAGPSTFYTREQIELLESADGVERFATQFIHERHGLVAFYVYDYQANGDIHVRTIALHPSLRRWEMLAIVFPELMASCAKHSPKALVVSETEHELHQHLRAAQFYSPDYAFVGLERRRYFYPQLNKKTDSGWVAHFSRVHRLEKLSFWRILPDDPIANALIRLSTDPLTKSTLTANKVKRALEDQGNVYIVATDDLRQPVGLLRGSMARNNRFVIEEIILSALYTEENERNYVTVGLADTLKKLFFKATTVRQVIVPETEIAVKGVFAEVSFARQTGPEGLVSYSLDNASHRKTLLDPERVFTAHGYIEETVPDSAQTLTLDMTNDDDEEPTLLQKLTVVPAGFDKKSFATAIGQRFGDRFEVIDFHFDDSYDTTKTFRSLAEYFSRHFSSPSFDSILLPPSAMALADAMEEFGYERAGQTAYTANKTRGLLMRSPRAIAPSGTPKKKPTLTPFSTRESSWTALRNLNELSEAPMSIEDFQRAAKDSKLHWRMMAQVSNPKGNNRTNDIYGFFLIDRGQRVWQLDQFVVDSRYSQSAQLRTEMVGMIIKEMLRVGVDTLLVPRNLDSVLALFPPSDFEIRTNLKPEEDAQTDYRPMVALERIKTKVPPPRTPNDLRVETIAVHNKTMDQPELRQSLLPSLFLIDAASHPESRYSIQDWENVAKRQSDGESAWILQTASFLPISYLTTSIVHDTLYVDRIGIDPRYHKRKTYIYYAPLLAKLAKEKGLTRIMLPDALLDIASVIRTLVPAIVIITK